MKPTKFKWAWDNKPPTDDPAMTRQRAALLLKSWRADQPRSRCCKVGAHTYRILTGDGYTATMVVVANNSTRG